MKRRERSSSEKQFDSMLRTGIMALGTNPTKPEPKIPFPYYLAWDRLGRQGERCKIIRQTTRTAQVEFEDGFKFLFNRQALRRFKP